MINIDGPYTVTKDTVQKFAKYLYDKHIETFSDYTESEDTTYIYYDEDKKIGVSFNSGTLKVAAFYNGNTISSNASLSSTNIIFYIIETDDNLILSFVASNNAFKSNYTKSIVFTRVNDKKSMLNWYDTANRKSIIYITDTITEVLYTEPAPGESDTNVLTTYAPYPFPNSTYTLNNVYNIVKKSSQSFLNEVVTIDGKDYFCMRSILVG